MSRIRSLGLVFLGLMLFLFGWNGILYCFAAKMWINSPVVMLMICLAIAWHEFGHLLFAWMTGIGIQEYSIGFGAKIIEKRIGETRFSFRLFPFGGYVDTADWNDVEEPDDLRALERVEQDMVTDDRRWFSAQPLWERLMMIAAGPLFNLVLGCVILLFVGSAAPVASPWSYVEAVWNPDVRGQILGIENYSPMFRTDLIPHLKGGFSSFGPAGIARIFAILNIGLAVLNLLPIPPLDGGVIVRELIHESFYGHQPIRRRIPGLRGIRSIWTPLSIVGLVIVVAIQFI